jgi:hypothetical protein
MKSIEIDEQEYEPTNKENQDENSNDEAQNKNNVPAIIVKIDKEGLLSFTNHLELAQAASIAIQTKVAPKHLRDEGREAVAAALLLCKQFRLPQKSMNQMGWVKDKLTCYGSLVTAMAERHPLYGEKKEIYIDENQEVICLANKNLNETPYAAIVMNRKKGQTHWTEYYFSMDDAAKAKLDKPKKRSGDINHDSPWIKYTKDMLMHKARARMNRAEYASALEGIDYHEDVSEALLRDVTPRGFGNNDDMDVAEELNKELELD